MAEAVFIDQLKSRAVLHEWRVDSAGEIDYHAGKAPYELTTRALNAHGIEDYKHRARAITDDDQTQFEYIFGMDLQNMTFLERHARAVPNARAKLLMLGTFDPAARNRDEAIIKDPYYDNEYRLFVEVYEQCARSCAAFLDTIYK